MLVVSGAMITVFKLLSISFGDTIMHGQVFLISLPRVGSSDTQ